MGVRTVFWTWSLWYLVPVYVLEPEYVSQKELDQENTMQQRATELYSNPKMMELHGNTLG